MKKVRFILLFSYYILPMFLPYNCCTNFLAHRMFQVHQHLYLLSNREIFLWFCGSHIFVDRSDLSRSRILGSQAVSASSHFRCVFLIVQNTLDIKQQRFSDCSRLLRPVQNRNSAT
jgi:hypothetical protein